MKLAIKKKQTGRWDRDQSQEKMEALNKKQDQLREPFIKNEVNTLAKYKYFFILLIF